MPDPNRDHPGDLVLGEDDTIRHAKKRIGRMVRDRWHIDELLGMGGMAAVYAATHRNGKRVALKILHQELSANQEVQRRFLAEGYAANRIDHPAAVSVLDDDISEDGEAFLVMDLFEGETLEKEILKRERLTEHDVLFIADTLLDVLAAAHDRGIIHRDVKPDNVFLAADGKVKLLDFGIACVCEPGRARHTESGTPLGTPAFMPPEQAFGHWEQIDGRTDLWSVGATMFTALTGQLVHQGRTDNEELLYAMTRRAPSIRTIAEDVSPDLAELIDRALAFEKEARWPDARAMQSAVRAVAETHRSRSMPKTSDRVEHVPSVALTTRSRTPVRASSPRLRRGTRWLGAAALSIAMGAGIAAVARSSEVAEAWSLARSGSDHVDVPIQARAIKNFEVSTAPNAVPDDRFSAGDLPADLPPGGAPAVSARNARATPASDTRSPVKRVNAPRPNRSLRSNTGAATSWPERDPIYDDPLPPPPELHLPTSGAPGDPLSRRQ